MGLIKNKQIVFLNFVLLQMFLSCFIAVSYMSLQVVGWKASVLVIFITLVFLGVLSIWTVKELLRLVKGENETEMALARLEENKALVRALKVKQHDFANHLQVIYGLMDLGKTDKVKEYMKNVTTDLKTLDRLAGLKSPELAALISKKMTQSEAVKLEPAIDTDLAYLEVPGDKVVSILGNLLDNAIFEAEKDPFRNRIFLKICERDGNYIFEVWNSAYIPEELQEKIFLQGFTTKGGKGSGMGLHIVKNLVSGYGGTLDMVSDAEEGTVFRVSFPIVKGQTRQL